jgi:hypothetical protein
LRASEKIAEKTGRRLSRTCHSAGAAQEVLDGDLTLLHGQERRLEAAGDWRSSFFLPTPSDAGVAAYRRWLNDMAGACAGSRLLLRDAPEERSSPRPQLQSCSLLLIRHCMACGTVCPPAGSFRAV